MEASQLELVPSRPSIPSAGIFNVTLQESERELTTKQGVAMAKTVGLSADEKTAKNLDAAAETDFVKIESFSKNVSAENRDKVYKILWQKYQNKLTGNIDAATRNQANKLKEIIEKSFPAERSAAKARAEGQ